MISPNKIRGKVAKQHRNPNGVELYAAKSIVRNVYLVVLKAINHQQSSIIHQQLTINMRFSAPILSLFILILLFANCKKDQITTDPNDKIAFATDTLSFDTIFTTIGSATKSFTIYNPNDQPINISRIYAEGDTRRLFRFNANGIAFNGTDGAAENIEVWAHDSIHVFVDVTIDPRDENTPFIIQDTVVVETNGNRQTLILLAWGQDAHFFGRNMPQGQVVAATQDTTWTNDKPYVIFNGIIVDSLHTLTIDPGVRVHIYNYGSIIVKGKLVVNGGSWNDTTQIVKFSGVRTENGQPQYLGNDYTGGLLPSWQQESDYSDIPGQWNGFIFYPNSEGTFKGAELRNGITAILATKYLVQDNTIVIYQTPPKLTIENTVIRDMVGYGIQNWGGDLNISNTSVFDCGVNNLRVEVSGQCNFVNNTFYNTGSQHINHRDPIVVVNNFIPISQTQQLVEDVPLNANFYNCLIMGDRSREEVVSSKSGLPTGAFNLHFYNTLFRTKEIAITADQLTDCYFNPAVSDTTYFKDVSLRDFRLHNGSFCIDKGTQNTPFSVSTDQLGSTRDALPDLGAFEYMP